MFLNRIAMKNQYTAKAITTIHASTSEVWNALTTPELVKQYFFGTDLHTSWEVGSPIEFTGEWQGQQYTDKGTVLAAEPNHVLEYSYLSSMSGLEDVPENYASIRYELSAEGEATHLEIHQDNIATKEAAEHSRQNWQMVLAQLKQLVEQR
jgi:uncharacterized protein YndB with AHSA1/START domain